MKSPKTPIATVALAICLSLASSTASAQKSSSSKSPYAIQSGEGWGICEAYTKALNALPVDADFPYCSIADLKTTGVSLPRWEVMDVEANLPLLHRIELGAWRSYRNEIAVSGWFVPPENFKNWKQHRLDRVRLKEQTPRLRRIRMPLVEDGQTETLLAYDGDIHACQQTAEWSILSSGYREGEASSPMKRLMDEMSGQLTGGPGWDTETWGEIVMYRQRPHIVMPNGAPGNVPELVVKRFENAVKTSSEYRERGDAGYLIRELCRIVRTSPLTSPLSMQPTAQTSIQPASR